MRVLLSSDHRYPAFGEKGVGLHPKAFPSGSGFWIHDLLVKGLAELGHDVFYLLRKGADKPLPDGVTLVSELIPDADILHTIDFRDQDLIQERQAINNPGLRRAIWISERVDENVIKRRRTRYLFPAPSLSCTAVAAMS
jgi:hypothetical protein